MNLIRSQRKRPGRGGSVRVLVVTLGVITASMTSPVVVDAPARAQGAWPGSFSAPFAEDPTFDARPPLTAEEAKRVPTAVHMAMMPDGRVVYWGWEGGEDLNGGVPLDAGRAYKPARSRILDLRTGAPAWATPGNERGGPAENEDLFCVDQRLLPDGRVLAVGGSIWSTEIDLSPITGDQGPGGPSEIYGTTATRWLDPRGDPPAWEGGDENRMREGRWYPTLVTLPDGRLLVASGVERLLSNAPGLEGGRGTNVQTVETFDPATDRWTQEPESADVSLPLYPRLHVTHDGRILYPGTGMMWNPKGESADEALWGLHKAYDPATRSWTVSGIGAFGVRSDALSVPLMFRAPYDETRILIAGGTLGPPPTAVAGTPLSEVVTYRDGVTSSARTGDLNNKRWFSSGVLLPDGHVLALSGGDKNGNVVPGSEAAVRQAEIFDPSTGRWTPLASGNRERTYHNTAILLPDGRVLVGGHAPQPYLGGRNEPSTPAGEAGLSAPNLKDPSFEIFTPPYLDPSLGPRPTIEGARAGVRYGAPFPMQVSGEVERVVLMRLPSTTHVTDADQRGIELPFERRGRSGLHVTAPPDANVAPPGYYYLFALSERGVPSKARIVQVGERPTEHGQAAAPFGV